MQLWNDYEGKTIAEAYSLGALLRPEGRSALFVLAHGAEAPAIIRLTEALNDEGQMLACWRRVAEVKQENLVQIKGCGQTNFEGTPLTYAVMEVTDANLADLLKERPLTYPEAMQVATSVAAALAALHAKGFVHGHIDPANVLAAGETVKLRTDCVRECIVDPEHSSLAECEEMVRRDVQDFATLLLQSLTLEKKLSPAIKLPAPFDKVIPNAMNGTWGLPEISTALTPPPVTPLIPEGVLRRDGTASPVPSNSRQSQHGAAIRQVSALADPFLRRDRPDDSEDALGPARQRVLLWTGSACVLVLILVLFLHFRKNKIVTPPQLGASPITGLQTNPNQAGGPATGRGPVVSPKPAITGGAQTSPESKLAVTAHMQPGWYVIAYTYSREDQAWKRVAAIMKKHASLNPEVITPSGHGPFLIALGGAMSRGEAEASRNRARRAGMPRDTFVRNYESR